MYCIAWSISILHDCNFGFKLLLTLSKRAPGLQTFVMGCYLLIFKKSIQLLWIFLNTKIFVLQMTTTTYSFTIPRFKLVWEGGLFCLTIIFWPSGWPDKKHEVEIKDKVEYYQTFLLQISYIRKGNFHNFSICMIAGRQKFKKVPLYKNWNCQKLLIIEVLFR